ncbi:MAG: hypothetical protein ACYTEG_15715, partial [Planctomycetota bacterium]
MRGTIGIACLLLFGLSLGVAFSQESKTVEPKDPVLREPVALDKMWSFHFEGKKQNGDFLELARPDAEKEGEGRTLVITHLEVRQRQTMNWAFVEHKKLGSKWKKNLRRSSLFSIGWLDGTTKYMVTGYSSYVGMKFGPKSRPSIEITQGSGNMAVYAEGY